MEEIIVKFTEKNAVQNGRTIVWVRKNGVSFLACDKLRQHYRSFDGWENEWQRPNVVYQGREYSACSITGEIVVAKRIKSRIVPPEAFFKTMWEWEIELEKLQSTSQKIFGTDGVESPMWRAIEIVLDEQACLALRYKYSPDEFRRVFHDPANRIAHGLKPLEV